MSFAALPFGLPGRLFRSPMPFGPYALHGDTDDGLCAEQMAVLVLRASDAACLHTTRCHLRTWYDQAGCQGRSLPIPDGGVPPREDLEQAVQHTLAYAQAGPHLVMHGAAGLGRTGRFRASLARRALGLSGAEAISWVRHVLPYAVETPEQQRLFFQDEGVEGAWHER